METVVTEIAVAMVVGALLGAGAVHGVVRWRATRVPLLRVKYRRMSDQAWRQFVQGCEAKPPPRIYTLGDRLADTFDVRRPDDSFQYGPETDLYGPSPSSVRYTYVRGPIRGRDTDRP